MHVFLAEGADEDAFSLAVAQQSNDLGVSSMVSVDLLSTALQPMAQARTILTIFSTFTQIFAMLICFFALIASVNTNIFEQTKEIGILRSLGFQRFPLCRLYAWESYVLVVSASVLGLVIGLVVAYTMMLQDALFTQLPLQLQFPYVQAVIIVAAGFVMAVLAAIGPMQHLLRRPITDVLRRTF
jgi:ABC-type antimicrobial peptide transport system permease subunit